MIFKEGELHDRVGIMNSFAEVCRILHSDPRVNELVVEIHKRGMRPRIAKLKIGDLPKHD